MEIFSSTLLKYRYSGTQKSTFEFLDFYLLKNETVLLTGASGSGKTTLLRLIEKSLHRRDCHIQQDCSVALIYQDLRLVDERTVLDNVLSGAFKELPSYSVAFTNSQKEKARYLLKKVQLLDHQNKLVSELSGGQKQRVAITRALMNSPQILLADECFSQLDKPTAMQIFSLIKSLQSEFKFSLLISQHTSVIDDSFFDRRINILPNSITTLVTTKKNKINFLVFWIFIFGLALASILTLDYSGFNSQQSLRNSLEIIKRFFEINSVTVSQFNWFAVFKSFLATLKMALLGSFFGFIIALPLAILAAKNISSPSLSKIIRFFLMTVRSIPSLVWALIFVAAFGIGAFAGVVALSFYTVGYLGKLIYESLEDLEQKSFASLRLLGASRLQAFMLGLLPKARPMLVAHFIFIFEYNIRAASILGLVGAGGIGQELMYNLEWRRFPQAGIILLIMVGIIFLADTLSVALRRHLLLDRGN